MPSEAIVQAPLHRAQRTVRDLGTIAFLLLIASAPLCFALGQATHGAPLIVTTSQTPPPRFTLAAFLDGSLMQQLERHLQEDAPTTWFLRGCYNELRHRLGILQNARVLLGPDGWMFQRSTLQLNEADARAKLPHQQRLAAQLKAEADALGVHVCAVVVPDKERLYPEFAYAARVMPPFRAGYYGQVIGGLREAGFDIVDADRILQSAKAARPDLLLYLRRDTHWSLTGAVHVASAVARHLESGPHADALGPQVEFAPNEVNDVLCVPDLTAMCGLLSYIRLEQGGQVSVGWGAVAKSLMEVKSFGQIALRDPKITLADLRPDAAIAMAGSSFSEENLTKSLAILLRRPIDDRYVHAGAHWAESLRSALAAISRGESKARVVVWEFVERHWWEQ